MPIHSSDAAGLDNMKTNTPVINTMFLHVMASPPKWKSLQKELKSPGGFTRLRQGAPQGSMRRFSHEGELRPVKMAIGDRGVAPGAKTGLPWDNVGRVDGFGGVSLGFATDAPRESAGSFTFKTFGWSAFIAISGRLGLG
jgi:hypothetical protein